MIWFIGVVLYLLIGLLFKPYKKNGELVVNILFHIFWLPMLIVGFLYLITGGRVL
ncbi:hypothetical protein D3C86_1128470 [compost metagenome]